MSKLNAQQEAAVQARNQRILVSASAGTGKTTVLVDRVMSLLQEGVAVNKLLILTFTKKAAEHMRQKLAAAIEAEGNGLSAEQRDAQLVKLEEADITTISAFAQKLLQEYYYRLNLDPEFSILSADVAKNRLRSAVWDEVVANFYPTVQASSGSLTAKEKLLYALTNAKGDFKLKKAIFSLYDFLAALADPAAWQARVDLQGKTLEQIPAFSELLAELRYFPASAEIHAIIEEYERRMSVYSFDDRLKETRQKVAASFAQLKAALAVFDQPGVSGPEVMAARRELKQLKLESLGNKTYKGIPATIDLEKIETIHDKLKSVEALYKKLKNKKAPKDLLEVKVAHPEGLAAYVEQVKHEYQTEFLDQIAKHYAQYPCDPNKQSKTFISNQAKLQQVADHLLVEFQRVMSIVDQQLATGDLDAEQCHRLYNTQLKLPFTEKGLEKMVDALDYPLEVAAKLKKASFGGLYENLDDPQEAFIDEQQLVPIFLQLYQEFAAAYNTRKDDLGLYEFSDIERKALQLLQDNPVELAELQAAYQEIIVDEYQDTNSLQDQILEMIAAGGARRFMVGDVKQSIYRFRQADHTLFMHKEQAYATDAAPTNATRLIRLNENYRSRKEVTTPINQLFTNLMTGAAGDLNYRHQELVSANPVYQQTLAAPAPFFKIHKLAAGEDKVVTQAQYVVAQIKALIGKKEIVDRQTGEVRLVKPGDIAILARSWSQNEVYLNELRKAGLNYTVARSDRYLDQYEIQVLLAYLQLLNNNREDIPLVAVLKSPLYRFNEPELAFLRLQSKGSMFGTLFALQNKDDQGLSEQAANLAIEAAPVFVTTLRAKIANFLADYDQLAALQGVVSLTELVQNILATTDLVAAFTALPHGAARRANLNGFIAYVEEMETAGITDVDALTAALNRETLDVINPQLAADSITFTTIHSSKGLEYPVVFLVNAEKAFNNPEKNQQVVWNKDELVLATPKHETIGKAVIELNKALLEPVRNTIMADNEMEEKRLLYVALTRAEQSLQIIGTFGGKDNGKTLSYLKWLEQHLANHQEYFVEVDEVNDGDDQLAPSATAVLKTTFTPVDDSATTPIVNSRYATTDRELKGKITRTAQRLLSGPTTDYHDQTAAHLAYDALGTAVHLLFEKHVAEPQQALDALLAQLVADGIIAAEFQPIIENEFLPGIQDFFAKSPVGQALLAAPVVHPEYEFSALVNTAVTFDTPEEDYTVVHGFVDCFYQDPTSGQYVIVDYKTDVNLNQEKVMRENYDGQLRLYAQALQSMGYPVAAAYVYGIRHQDFFEVNLADLNPGAK